MPSGLYTSQIPNLINGISQQPDVLRLASQGAIQENGYSSVVDGLQKRPGTSFKFKVGAASVRPYVHLIYRDDTEKYHVTITNGAIKVHDLNTGLEKSVAYTAGTSYLVSAAPRYDFEVLTVADYTFILNKTITVAQTTDTSAVRPREAVVWIRQGSYGCNYRVTVNGTTATKTTSTTDVSDLQTDSIASTLAGQLTSGLGGNFTVTTKGSSIYIRRVDGADFSISTSDSIGDTAITLVKDKVQRFSDLPAEGVVNGFRVEVTGDSSSAFDNYFVEYVDGVWSETIKGGESIGLNPLTMPHALKRLSDGSFSFEVVDWDERSTGDLTSNPMPSFVGRKISDVFFHRNRLGFIAEEGISLSKAGEFFTFFRDTVTQLLDSDPIDVQVSTTRIANLRHAVPFNETLLLFADNIQFQLGSATILTPSTINVSTTTELECSRFAKPVGAGRNVYFGVERGDFAGMREYYVNGDTETSDANDVTANCPRYVTGKVFKIAASGNDNVVLLLSEDSPNKIFCYKYYYAEDGVKLQSSWSEFSFGACDEIVNVEFIETDVFVTMKRGSSFVVEVFSVAPQNVEPGWDIDIHMDSKFNVNTSNAVLTWDGGTDITTIVVTGNGILGNNNSGSLELIEFVTTPVAGQRPGLVFKPLSVVYGATTVTLTFDGDISSYKFLAGLKYALRYRFSVIYVREQTSGGGVMASTDGRLQMRKMELQYANSGYFRTEVTPLGRDKNTYVCSGRTTGSILNPLGNIAIGSGVHKFPLMSENKQLTIEIINDTFLPSNLLNALWEGLYTRRSGRI